VRVLSAATLACALIAIARPAAATPAQELDAARAQFRNGEFAAAVPQLNYLLYPTPRLSQPSDLVEAHVLLAVCAFETGDRKTARREFEEALFLDRDLALDTLLFSARAVEYFEDIKQELEDREARDAEQRRLAEENERLQRVLNSMVVIETRPYYVNFLPFGAGQFQNGDRGKGLFFAASQGVTGGVSAGIWLYLVGEFGLPGKVAPDRIAFARRLQQIEIGTGTVCLGLMAWGVIDSLLNYEPSARIEADESLIPPDLRKARPPPKTSRLELRPELLVTPSGDAAPGLSLTWEH
jgi:hypothetical protein